MSGSGGGGGVGGYEPSISTCDSLVIETLLSSPKPSVVANLSLGAILLVQTQQSGGVTVVVLLYQNEVAGGLASPQVARLRECIEQGTQYQANVISISNGQVRVRIKAVGVP